MIVGVHGIAKQQLGRRQIRKDWLPALGDGLERAHGARVPDPPLDLAYYGDLFLPATPARRREKGAGDSDAWLANLAGEEFDSLLGAAGEAVSDTDIATAAAEDGKGYTRVPGPLQAVLRALDRRFGPSAGALYLGELRQVRRYLGEESLKAMADEAVRTAMTAEGRVLIGHSLGSIVAFEFVRQNADHQLDLLLTIGSPLGLRMVRRLMPDAGYGAETGIPANVAAWVNIRDPHDPVTCAGDLTRWWPGIADETVNNQGDAHAAERYLGKKETGVAVLAAAPGLAS